MSRVWNDKAKYQSWLDVELAACEANCKLGQIPADAMQQIREKAGRNKTPTASIIDSQTVKTTAYAKKEEVGFDCAKKTKGKKRHIAVDVLGLILSIVITRT